MKIHKDMTNTEIAHLLNSIAAAYEIKDEDKNRFRIQAYQRAADAVEHLSIEAKDLWDDNELEKVGGIGEAIAGHLDEIFRTGKSKHFAKVMKGIKPAAFELTKVSGIGPKTAHKLTDELNITTADGSLEALEEAGKEGKIAELEGMGEDSQEAILSGIKEVRGREERLLLAYAANLADEIVSYIKKEKAAKEVDALGSLRRKAATVGDIDVAAASDEAEKVINHFTDYPKAVRTIEKGEREASILLPGEVQVDLKVLPQDSYGSLLQHFTGSKHHNIELREYANKKGMSLSEYGIKSKVPEAEQVRYEAGKGKKSPKQNKFATRQAKVKKFKTEEKFYKKLGMDWIPPELREARGEINASLNGKLPNLLELKDIKGDLQIHSDFDIETSHDVGESSMKEIVNKASELGYEYIAFTEHNPSQSGHNDKQTIDLLKKKKEKIDKLNSSLVKSGEKGVKRVFNSLEIDILPDGKLPVQEKGLELLDFALVSIHSSFRQTRKKMTKRVLSALGNPNVKVFAHPTGRKLNHREGVELEWDQIFNYCKDNDIWLEINADPMRLDLPDNKVKDAVDKGVRLTLGTDAHHVDGLDNMPWGLSVARRGWAEKKDIVNSRSLSEFEKMIGLKTSGKL